MTDCPLLSIIDPSTQRGVPRKNAYRQQPAWVNKTKKKNLEPDLKETSGGGGGNIAPMNPEYDTTKEVGQNALVGDNLSQISLCTTHIFELLLIT